MSFTRLCLIGTCLLVLLESVLCVVITREDERFCGLCCRAKRQRPRYRGYICPGCDRCVLEDISDSSSEAEDFSTEVPHRRQGTGKHRTNTSVANNESMTAADEMATRIELTTISPPTTTTKRIKQRK